MPIGPERSRASTVSPDISGPVLANLLGCARLRRSCSGMMKASRAPRASRRSSRKSRRVVLSPTGNPAADGVLLVDKPAGFTSHDVVAIARGAMQTKRIGHTGTLDPFATGLLVLLIGQATRLAQFVDGEPKVYETTIAFGAETDTDDLTGSIVREAAPPTPDAVDTAIAALTGPLDQIPPAYSA